MHKTLIIKAFEKGKALLKKQGVKNPSLTLIAENLALFVEKHEGLGLNEKSYRIYNSEAKKLMNTNDDISIKQLKVVNGLCKYLGYDNYTDFELAQKDKSFKDGFIFFFRKFKVILFMSTLFLAGLIIFNSIQKQRWMIWVEDHYEEVKFNPEQLQDGVLKVYKKDRIEFFKKLENADCDTPYFKNNGEVNLWYGKHINGDIELFTSTGLHPETGKTLKPITVYMIRKYFCSDY